MSQNKLKTDNGLTIGVDWISFTVSVDETVDGVIEFMGFDAKYFRDMPNGSNGYKHMKKYQNISVLYDGAENMGIHVNISGSSVGTLLDSYKETLFCNTPFGKGYDLWDETILSHFFNSVLSIGHFTRLDLAIDDLGCNYYDLDEIINKFSNNQIISKWRNYRDYSDRKIIDNSKDGHTVYLGSKQSDILLRIYDKQLERNKGLSVDDEQYISFKWIRWELELHKGRADEMARKLIGGMSLSAVAMGILCNYFRIINLDNANKSRCSSEQKWIEFTENASKLRIFVPREEKTLDERVERFEKQHGRTVALIYAYKGGDFDYFPDLAIRYACKLTPHDKELLGDMCYDH